MCTELKGKKGMADESWFLPFDQGWNDGAGNPPNPYGIKTDYATYLRVDPAKRAWFHASGAIATKVAPFVAVVVSPATNAPAWAVLLMGAYGVGQIATDVAFSVKSSDWKRFRRERAVARELRSR